MNSTGEFFGQVAKLTGRIIFPVILLAIITAISVNLIIEAGAFFGGIWKAACLEIGAIALIAWRPKEWSWLNLVRGFVLMAAFGLVIAGAGFHAARPHLEADGLNPADRMKLRTLQESIGAYERSVEAVAGQPRNSAIAARELREAIEARDQFLATVETDAAVVAAHRLAILTAVSFRIVLQSVSWLLVHILAGMILRREKATTTEEETGHLIALPNHRHLDPDTEKLLMWIESKGEATRLQIMQSKTLDGGQAYDRALDSLIRSGLIHLEASGPMNGWKYSIINRAVA